MNSIQKIIIFSPYPYIKQLLSNYYDEYEVEINTQINNLEEFLKTRHYNLYIIDYFEDFDYNDFWFKHKILYENYINSLIFLFPNSSDIIIPNSIKTIKKPIYLDYFINLIDKSLKKNQQFYPINDIFSFYPYAKILLKKDGSDYVKINLTEKEVAIINFLLAQNNIVSKEDLLKTLWNYNSLCDTHTLETHIYRLRQKLGADNALIINSEKGYMLDSKCKEIILS